MQVMCTPAAFIALDEPGIRSWDIRAPEVVVAPRLEQRRDELLCLLEASNLDQHIDYRLCRHAVYRRAAKVFDSSNRPCGKNGAKVARFDFKQTRPIRIVVDDLDFVA